METTINRLSYVRVSLIGTSLIVIIGFGLVGYNSIIPHNELLGKLYTDSEYQQIKIYEINKIRNREIVPPTSDEVLMWEALLQKECNSITIHNVKSSTFINQLNTYLLNGCKE